MRAAVYLRISNDRSGEELGVSRQREDAEDLIARRGWELAEVFTENDTSAAGRKRRPKFDALIAQIRAGHLDAVVAWALDRLVRTARDRLALVEACRETDTIIALVRGSDMDPTTPAGRLTLGILGEVAQHEIDSKSDRQRRAAQQLAAAGKPAPGPVPFGFLPDRVAHHTEQAAAIRDAYSAILAGATLAGVARAWNAGGLTSGRLRTGRMNAGEPSEWSAETVKALLLKPRNAGLRASGEDYEVVGPAVWEPIVPEETWRAVVAILTDPRRRGAVPASRHLLSGVARCGTCGATVFAGSTRPTYFSYRCSSRGHVARRGDHVDAWIGGGTIEDIAVAGIVLERLRQPDAADLLPNDVSGPDIERLRARAQSLRSKLDTLAIQFADDAITASQLHTSTMRTRDNLATVEAELTAAGRTSVLGPLITSRDPTEAWTALDVDRRRAVIDTLMTITLHPPGRGTRYFDPSTIEIIWRQA